MFVTEIVLNGDPAETKPESIQVAAIGICHTPVEGRSHVPWGKS
jgi:hypothetical protein